jgi:peptidoglycan DL-endopeptidase CwlO
VSAVAALVLVMMPGAVAHAEPTVAEIEAQIAQKWAESEPLIEQYNSVHQQYEQNLARQAELQAAIDPLRIQVELAQVRVGAIAAQAYRGSDASVLTALLTDGTPQALADRLAFLDSMSREQSRELQGVIHLKAEYDTQKAPIDQLVAELAAQDKDLADKKAVIESQLAELQALRRQAYGTTGGTGSYRPWPCPSTYAPTAGYQAAAFACAQAGDPYVWAAEGPNAYDCSGLTLASWAQVGVYLPHNAAAQRRSMPYVDRADLQVGDLVFYYADLHHVAIYVGDGKIMHAPYAGDNVRMANMDSSGPIHSFGRPG